MQFFIISHFFFIKVSLDTKMGLCFLEKNCHRKSEISFLPSLKAKLLFPVCDGIPCIAVYTVIHKCISMTSDNIMDIRIITTNVSIGK